jgi:ribosome-associated translation inhibitor RaiA
MRVSVRGKRIEVGPELREEVTRRLYFALGRFADVIREVRVQLTDLNGPRGGIDKHSRLVVLLKPAEQVVAEATDVTVMAAVDRTCYRVKRLVGRAVEDRNERPSTRIVRPNGFHKEE